MHTECITILDAATHMCMQKATAIKQLSSFVYSSRTVGVGYVHRRLSNTMSTCTIWVGARLNTFSLIQLSKYASELLEAEILV